MARTTGTRLVGTQSKRRTSCIERLKDGLLTLAVTGCVEDLLDVGAVVRAGDDRDSGVRCGRATRRRLKETSAKQTLAVSRPARYTTVEPGPNPPVTRRCPGVSFPARGVDSSRIGGSSERRPEAPSLSWPWRPRTVGQEVGSTSMQPNEPPRATRAVPPSSPNDLSALLRLPTQSPTLPRSERC